MVKFAVEFWWKMLLTILPSKRSSKISFQTSQEARHQFRRKLRQLHSGNRWCLEFRRNRDLYEPLLTAMAQVLLSRNGLDVCYCLPGVPSGARTATELPPMSYAGLFRTQVPHFQDGSRPSPARGVTLRRFPLPFWQVCLSL